MKGPLCRAGYGSIPSGYGTTTSGIQGVVTQIFWGDLMASTLYTTAAGFSPTNQPAGYAGGFAAAVGSTIFLQDQVAMETSTTGSMGSIISDLTHVEQNLAAGAGVKLRWFSGVQSTGTIPLNSGPPPSPTWLSTLCGIFVVRDRQNNSCPSYWATGKTYTSGTKVLSTIDGLQYSTTAAITSGANTIDPGSGAPHWGTGQLGPYGGPVVRWFGASAANYLAALSYFQLLLANCRVWIDCQNYMHAGDSQTLGHGTGTWHVGPRPTGKDDTNSTAFTLDTCPMIQEVTMSACCTVYGEVCNRQTNQSNSTADDASNLAAVQAQFLNAGYTTFSGLQSGHTVWSSGHQGAGTQANPAADSDVGAIVKCQAATATAWPHTCVSEAHNPFQIQPVADVQNPTTALGNATTLYLVNQLIAQCEPGQASPGNNSLNNPVVQLDRDVTSGGGPAYFQTAARAQFNSGATVQNILTNGMSVGAFNIELPSTFQNDLSGPSELLAIWNTWKGYINNGTGPAGATTAYAASNVRSVSGLTFINNSPPATATVGTSYSYTYTASAACTFALASGTLPDGLTLTTATTTSATLAGTPTTSSQTAHFTVKAFSAVGTVPSAPTTITVGAVSGAPVFVNDDPPDGTLGVVYDGSGYQVTVATPSGVTYALSTSAGLTGPPLGITLSSSGLLAGTPYGLPGDYTFAVIATDGSSRSTSTGTITITIADPYPFDPVSAVRIGNGYALIVT